MNRRRHAYQCPQCGYLVHLSVPPPIPHPSGLLVLDTATQVRAMVLHMRTGCSA